MSKRSALIVIGILSILVAIAGLPQSWKQIWFLATGVLVAVIAFFLPNFRNEILADQIKIIDTE
jgi:hypothetical protein